MKPSSNPYLKKLTTVMTKYLTGRFGQEEGKKRWERTMEIAQKYWDETTYAGNEPYGFR